MNSGPNISDEFMIAVYRGDHKRLNFLLYSVNEIPLKTIKDALNYAVLADAVDTVELIFSLMILDEADIEDALRKASFAFFEKMHGAIQDKIRQLPTEKLKTVFTRFTLEYMQQNLHLNFEVCHRRGAWLFEQLLSKNKTAYTLPNELVYPLEPMPVPTQEQMVLVNAWGDEQARNVLLPQYRNSIIPYEPRFAHQSAFLGRRVFRNKDKDSSKFSLI
ncbi:MAG: hypothetical protein JSR17_03565 [Proteobacteria bacterium]|nr:hypothetical protein [Pseudomonadota bacterium]